MVLVLGDISGGGECHGGGGGCGDDCGGRYCGGVRVFAVGLRMVG